ncbi:uncharacterized protein N7473_005062 [Penicillium subrubescens]|uniref:uncharacterized protein n=1 Tax=Penicillium subrubescens TaxID=1316194 RepID=UPI0025456DF7|nr:uncharacterized protein N7473_005062 [Penicillium subrubescens]KAJ5900992.1 hypothetical protein N7473_005062 [Penicillium subrubescens]
MALPDSGSMQSVSDDPNNPSNWTVVWTELRAPIGHESDKQRWVGYFQPLVHAAGHKQSIWARLRFNPDKVILGTCNSACRDFESSPLAQLFREQLTNDGITFLTCYEFPDDWYHWFQSLLPRRFIYIFWVYFKVPVTEEQKQRVAKSVGIRPPVVLNLRPNQRLQPRLPVKLWATRTEYLHGEEPHIWRDEEAASWRLIKSRHINSFGETNVDKFHGFLRDIGSMEFKEDYCHFEELPRL